MSKKGHLHFLGIGGHAMRGVALACRELGYAVTGTDEGAYPPGSDWLDEYRFTWWRKPDPAHLKGVTEVVISGHVMPDHPEVRAAQAKGLPLVSFAELIGRLTGKAERIVVAGTHGKTTTTSLITWLLEASGQSPDFLIGIQPKNFDSSVRLAGGSVAVIEGDEYRASQLEEVSKFAYYQPDILVLTSIELDHPDFFKGLDDITDRFRTLVAGVPPNGKLLYWGGSPLVREAAEDNPQAESYGLTDAAWWADDIRYEPNGLHYTLMHHQDAVVSLHVPLYGAHNVMNSVAASAVALEQGMTAEVLQEAMITFMGASRRFERVSAPDATVAVFDDYAHHPTEVKTTIQAAKLHFPGRVIAVFRPHTFSRTEELLNEYHQAFEDADLAFIADIEEAREQGKEHRISGADVAAGAGDHVKYVEDRHDLVQEVAGVLQPGDTVLCMTVNGYDRLAQEIAELRS